MSAPLRVVALDLGLAHTGIAVTHDQAEQPRLSCRTVSPRRRPTRTVIDHERLHETIGAIQGAVRCNPDLVVVEKPLQVAGQGDTSVRLGELHGAIKHWLWAKKLTYVDVNLVHVKQYATGKGNAQKREVLEAVIARYGSLLHVHTDHEADAVSLLAQALHAYGRQLAEVPAQNAKAVTGTDWPDLEMAA